MKELKEIYLEPVGCACPKEGQMWCEDTQVCDNCEKPYTPYIRADLAIAIGKFEELIKNTEAMVSNGDDSIYVVNSDDLQALIDDHKK